MSAPPPTTAAAATSVVESTIAPALFLLVPLFTLALVVLALSHRPQLGNTHGDARPQARVAYAFIGALAVLSTLAGALPLTLSHSEALQQAEAVMQAFLCFLLGVPALHVASAYATHSANRHRLLGTLHFGLLAMALSGATLLALLAPFLPSSSTPQYLPPALFLVYSALALPRIALTLFRFLHPSSSTSSTSASSSTLFFLRSRARPRRPITIHVETHRTSIPLSLPSPASSAASFPLSDAHHDGTEANRNGEQPIELEITLPKRKDSRSRLNQDQDRYLYQDQGEKHQPEKQKAAQDSENEKHQTKHEKNTSLDSSTSTVTAVDHANVIARYHRSLSPPLTSLTTPPRAAYTSAVTPPPFSSSYPRVEEHLYRFPHTHEPGAGSNENEDTGHGTNSPNRSLREQLLKSRSRSLLVFLCAAQLTLLVGYACALGADLSVSSASNNTTSASTTSTSTLTPNSGSASASFRIVQAACTVLAVTGTMSAYLLHAYNTHLSSSRQHQQHQPQSRSRTPAQQIIDLSRARPGAPNLPSMSYNTPTSAPSSAYSRSYSHANTTPAPGLGPVQTIDISAANSSGGPKPVVIQLAPPPPPRMRRKRLDALSVSGPGSNDGSQSSSSPTRSNEEQQAGMSYMAHDVSYTYPYSHGPSNSTQENGQPNYQHEQQQQQNQYQPYPPPPLPKRGPVVLTYVPPKKYGETQSSLLEVTETEGEADVNGHDLYLEDLEADEEELDMDMEDIDGDLNLGDEMAKALSRSSSMATTMSNLSIGGRTKRRTSTRKSKAIHQVVASKPNPNKPKPKSKRKEEDPATYIRKRGSVPIASRSKRLFGWEFAWDPLPSGAAAQAKERERERERELREAEVQESSFMDLRGATTTVTSTATATTTTTKRKLKRYSTPGGPMAAGKSPLSRDAAKLEKLEDIFGLTSVDSATTAGGAKKLKKRSKSASRPDSTENTMPVPQPFPAQLSHSHSHSTGLPIPVAGSPPASGSGSGSGSGSAGPSAGSFNLGRGFGIGHRTMKSSSSSGKTSRPGTAESKTSYNQGMHGNGSKVSLGSVSSMRRGGLQLKKSFKMGVGRTLGPGLTLASASVGGGVGLGRDERIEKVRAWEKRLEEEAEETAARRSDERDGEASIYAPTMDDDDVDGEIRSLAAARLVSASIARATPAATILTAPSSAGVTTPPPTAFPTKFHTSPATITYPVLSSSSNSNSNAGTRPTLPAIITSPIPILIPDSPVKSAQHPFSAPGLPTARTHLSPTSTNQPHTSGSTWKPHPFADPADSPARTGPAAMGQVSLSSSPEDDVVQLEREMEEIRSRGKGVDGQDALDSPSAPFKELAAFAVGPITPVSASASSGVSIPAPSISASMSPSVTSMFALAQAQAQTVAPPPLPMLITQNLASQKAKGKISAGDQKRPPLSAPPAPMSNWGPQHLPVGNGGSSTGGFPYKFPMIFPHSFTGGSPPRSSAYMNQPPQQSNSTPGTPSKGQSTLRLSAMTMGTVRNAFAGVGARMSNATMRMSVNGNGVVSSGLGKLGSGNAFGEMITEGGDGDFMDLRDPFASPPPASKITTSLGNAGNEVFMIDAASGRRTEGGNVVGGGAGAAGVRRRMSTWGKLPMPARSFSPVPSAGSSTTAGPKKNLNAVVRAVRIVGKPSAHRKHKKRSRKSATLPSMTTALGAMNMKEDADFGIEEALLSQRLLSRLDKDGWESRA